ncbi:MAG TPA: hypothetical protein DHV08_08265 [Rhodocyclaceae bacterium]|nr:hypothetical protein [Rhodocyclaceae bacterium]
MTANTSTTQQAPLVPASSPAHGITPEQRYRMIAEAAYYLAEKRGFVGGDMAADWLQAEAEIDRKLRNQESAATDIEQRVRTALAGDPAGIAQEVRAITLQALSHGKLDKEALKQVMTSVVQAALQGSAQRAKQGTQALKEALRGLDEALAAAAEAAQLAIQEAAGRTGEFSRQGLKRATDDLAVLESLLVETLTDVAREAQGNLKATLQDIINHARASGMVVGRRVMEATGQLAQVMAKTAHEQVEADVDTLRKEGELLAGLIAGALQGIAAHLQKAAPKSKQGKTD